MANVSIQCFHWVSCTLLSQLTSVQPRSVVIDELVKVEQFKQTIGRVAVSQYEDFCERGFRLIRLWGFTNDRTRVNLL